MSSVPTEDLPNIPLNGSLDGPSLRSVAPALAQRLRSWLPEQRWFGDKTQAISALTVADSAIDATSAGFWLWLLIDLSFADGTAARYLVPLAIVSNPPSNVTPLARLAVPSQRLAVVDAFCLAAFRTELIDQLLANHALKGANGTMEWQATPSQMASITNALATPGRISAAEQSNTSVIYDDAVILKVFRKIQPGINPEIEIGHFLTAETSFRNIPALLGTLTYTSETGHPASLAVAQSFVPNQGDGWSFTLHAIQAALHVASSHGEGANNVLDAYSRAAERLGRRTGQLHVALATATSDAAFQPEPVTEADINSWRRITRQSLSDTVTAIATRHPHVNPDTQQVLNQFQQSLTQLEGWTEGFSALSGTTKIRVHGDYHLGQTLRTMDDDFVILDFEGEPARSLAERRVKTSALKDVAGMLRSFTYARGAAARSVPTYQRPPELADWLADWERQARAAFTAGYRAETTALDVAFIPTDRADFDTALAAWELDKALYEIRYELNNRPDWLAIPLTGLV